MAPEKTIREAMEIIDANTAGIVLVIESDCQILGTLTDGNIRRALLKGACLDSPLFPYINKRFVHVNPELSRAEILDLMQVHCLNQIPIVNASGKLVGLHLLREILGAVARPNWAVVMAGGKGTRLYPLTENLPKPMIKVAGRPILERIVLHLVGFGIKRIFLAIHYLGNIIEGHFGDGSRFGCKIEYLRESEPMGTGGAVSLLPEIPRDPLLIMNGDLVTQLDINRILAFHSEGNYHGTMGVRRYLHSIPFGTVEIENQQVLGLEEKPTLAKYINTGVYILSPELVRAIPKSFFPMTSLFEQSLKKGERIGAFEIEEDWIDVGRFEQLKQARAGIPG